mgnify:CR=1 FL=1
MSPYPISISNGSGCKNDSIFSSSITASDSGSSTVNALDWDLENQRLSMYGIIVNPSKLLVDDYKLRQWTKAVQSMSDKFETKDFINFVVREYHCSERTAKNWLKKLVNCEILIRTGHGRYEKKLEIVDEIISEET